MKPDPERPSSLIQSVDVDDLFGQFRYRIRSPASLNGDDQLLLLYGDNGAGKSTILNILFHLLHPEPFEGHRSTVGSIPFRSVKIELTSGFVITAERDDPFNENTYNIRLVSPLCDSVIECSWQHDRRTRDYPDSEYSKYCQTLESIGIVFHYLSDTRRVSGRSQHLTEEFRTDLLNRIAGSERHYSRRHRDRTLTQTELPVGEAVDQTIDRLRRLALTGTSEGYTSVNRDL